MAFALDVLAIVLLVLLVPLRRMFTGMLSEPRALWAPRFPVVRALLYVWGAAAVAFTALGLWALATSGHLAIAALFVVVLVSIVRRALARRRDRD